MKLLYLTDTHIRGSNPKNRKDLFIDTIERKLLEVKSIALENNIDYIIHGGDFFDRPDVAVSVVSRFANIINSFDLPIYTVAGNHDIFGHNPQTLNRTMLGLLNSIGLINVIDENEKVLINDGDMRVQITGQPYIYDLDEGSKEKYILKEKSSDIDYAIHIVHGMLLDKPFLKGVPHTIIDEIKETKADITLSGHYHSGYNLIEINNKYFINPGSLVRLSNSKLDIKRKPKVIIISLDKTIDIEEVYLKSAEDGNEVLDRTQTDMGIFKENQLYQFKQSIESSVNFNKLDINEILIDIASSEDIENKIKQEALRRIELSQLKKAGENSEIY